ncbi:hypothetical protein PPYR_02327 [Photinus pyralis]|uniref:Uncharacterized protein n=1 Tax=Photinus pyralis TaxID=7054 RepID=A0A5N4B6X8_PHOPY|nr:uncharacterized protein LOC116165349 [Photinus pyralis]KAB0805357.1 hypothetical protein PPYR_02327 [Photinus pyralis]
MGKRRRKSPVSRIDVKRRRLLRKLDKLDRASGLHKESSCSSDTADTRSERGSTPMESNSDYGHFEDLIHEDSIAFSEQDENRDPNESVEEIPLSSDILKIIGCDGSTKETGSQAIRKELVSSWSDVIKRRLSEEVRADCVLRYPPPKNCLFLEAPKLNLEVVAAVNDVAKNRDNRLIIF